MTRTRIVIGWAVVAALSGCQTMEDMAQPTPRSVAAPSHPTYCYRTLAAVNCYLTPRPGDTLVGIDVPPPAATQTPGTQGTAASENARPPRTQAPPPSTTPAPTAMPSPPPPVVSEPVTTSPQSGPAQLSPYGNGGRRSGE